MDKNPKSPSKGLLALLLGAVSIRRRQATGSPGSARLSDSVRLDADLARRLKDGRTRLGASNKGTETEFLAISEILEKLSTQGDDLVKGSERLIELSLGKVEGVHLLQEIPALVNTPIEFIAKFNEEVRQLIERLTQMGDTISTLLQMQTRLAEAFAPLRIIQVLYRIEAERLAEKDRRVFHALTAEMSRIEERMLSSFEQQFAQLSNTREQLRSTIVHLQAGVQHRDVQFQGKRTAIDRMVERVDNEVKLNEQRESRLSQVSHQLNAEINRVVMAIQHQDIIEQRLKHVDTALLKLEDLVAAFPKTERKKRRQKLALVHSFCRLQNEQLQEVRQQINDSFTEIDGGLDTVTNTIRSVDAQCMNLNDFGHVTAAVDGMVQVLLDTLSDVSMLLRETLSEADKTYEIIRPLGGQAADLTVTVTNLSLAIKLIALNAQVQAGKLESAESLEVLSARTSEIADAANHISLEVAEKLETFSREMDRFVRGFEDLRSAGQQEVAELNGQSESASERLHRYRDTTLQSLMDVSAMIERLNELSGQRQVSATSRTRLNDEIDGLAGIIDRVESAVARICDPADLELEDGLELEELMKSYTMVSERSVHQRVTRKNQPEPALESEEPVEKREPGPVAQSTAGQDLGDNIELF
ncbi:hypothetical protein GC207_06820 [bacterium]|nr:hypothetical protein [bacterium]